MNTSLYINGQWTNAGSRQLADSYDPATGESLGKFVDATVEDFGAAIAVAHRAFQNPIWSQNPRLRQQVLNAWAANLERRAEEIAQLLTRENGKVLAQSRGELVGAISEIRYYAGLARHIPGHALEVEPGVFSTMIKEPAGVAAIIVPWNAPVVLLIRSLAPALAAGCTAIVKPAPQTVLTSAAVLQELFRIEGLPPGVVNFLTEMGHGGAQLLTTAPEIDVVSFTGSNLTGQRIMAAAAPTMKKLSLELGGKSCCIVFEDADIQNVVPKIAAAATVISGQQCTAARRILVHSSRYEAVKNLMKDALQAVSIGSGLNAGIGMGPLIDPITTSTVQASIERAMDEADEVVLKGTRLQGDFSKGCFVSPTLVAHRDTSSFFVQEEIFGPFVVIESFDSEAEAVKRANHTEFGLSASVWTDNGARAWRMARALRNGTVWINDHNKLFAEAETGGYRRSGLGRLHGVDALIDFTEIKHIYQSVGVVPYEG